MNLLVTLLLVLFSVCGRTSCEEVLYTEKCDACMSAVEEMSLAWNYAINIAKTKDMKQGDEGPALTYNQDVEDAVSATCKRDAFKLFSAGIKKECFRISFNSIRFNSFGCVKIICVQRWIQNCWVELL